MNPRNISILKERIEFIKSELSKEETDMISRLSEKGVECTILVPIFESVLGFDPVKDINYEYTSNKRYERFDFLIDGKFIVEAKKLNEQFSVKLTKQLEKYIAHHDEINYGILSNGCDFAVFIQKSFIKNFLPPERTFKISFNKEVFHVFTVSIFDNQFYQIMELFSKDCYHDTFSKLAKFSMSVINQQRSTKIVDDKELNVWLQEKITKTMDVQHGALLEEIQNGYLAVGDILTYKDEAIEIEVVVQNDGRVTLNRGAAIVKDMLLAMEKGFNPMIDLVRGEWRKNDIIFNHTDEIIKMASGKERLRRNMYKFIRK
ncbi:MAG: hypothetical protein AAF694_19695 [Bacteroidota bacterium]